MRNRWHALLGLLFLVTAGVAVTRAITPVQRDFDVFLLGAQRLLAASYVTVEEPNHFTYPPFFALLIAPFTALPLVDAKLLWAGLSILLLLLILRQITQLVVGFRAGDPRLAAPESVAALAFFLAWPGTLAVFQNEQFDILVLAFVLWGIGLALEDRPIRSGLCFGTATALKCTPALFLLLFLIKRNFRLAGAMLLSAALLSALPDLFLPGPGPGKLFLADWIAKIVFPLPGLSRFVDPTFTHSLAPGSGINGLNQSLGILIHRICSARSDSPIRVFALTDGVTDWIKRAVFVGVLLPLFRLRSFFLRWSKTEPTDRLRAMILMLPLMLLFSPMSSKSHFVALLLPAVWVIAAWRERPSRGLGLALIGLFLLGIFSGRDVLGPVGSELAYQLGPLTWCTLGLYGLMIGLASTSRDQLHEVVGHQGQRFEQ